MAEGEDSPAEEVEALRLLECEALSRAKLAPSEGGFVREWALGNDLAGALWPVAHSAIGLLTSGSLGRVKGCAGCN